MIRASLIFNFDVVEGLLMRVRGDNNIHAKRIFFFATLHCSDATFFFFFINNFSRRTDEKENNEMSKAVFLVVLLLASVAHSQQFIAGFLPPPPLGMKWLLSAIFTQPISLLSTIRLA